MASTPEHGDLEAPLVDAGHQWRSARDALDRARADALRLAVDAATVHVSKASIARLSGLAFNTVLKVVRSANVAPLPADRSLPHRVWLHDRKGKELPAPRVEFHGNLTPEQCDQVDRLVAGLKVAGDVYTRCVHDDNVARDRLAAAIQAAVGHMPLRQIAGHARVNNNLDWWLWHKSIYDHT